MYNFYRPTRSDCARLRLFQTDPLARNTNRKCHQHLTNKYVALIHHEIGEEETCALLLVDSPHSFISATIDDVINFYHV